MYRNLEQNNKKCHYSWDSYHIDITSIKTQLEEKQIFCKRSEYAQSFQHSLIPVYDLSLEELTNKDILQNIYDTFFNNSGVFIVKNVYDKDLINRYNNWTNIMLEKVKEDKNFRHPKQEGKFLINDLIGRMSETDPELLMEIITNEKLLLFSDLLLGMSKYGSLTGHIISGGGDRQKTHVDYPVHIGSGPFWENSIDKFKSLTTRYQLNNILPFYSIQILVACCDMDISNGSTEVIPCSHLIPDIDLSLHNKEVYDYLENLFVNVKLEKRDILIFNRGICHRGGKNTTQTPRNSFIFQLVWLWGVCQEIIDYDKIYQNIKDTDIFKNMSEDEKEKFLIRLKAPYPINVKDKT